MPCMKSFVMKCVFCMFFFSNVVVLSLKQVSSVSLLVSRGHFSKMSVSEIRECVFIIVFVAYHKAKALEGLSILSIAFLPPSSQCVQSTVGTMQNEQSFKINCKHQ